MAGNCPIYGPTACRTITRWEIVQKQKLNQNTLSVTAKKKKKIDRARIKTTLDLVFVELSSLWATAARNSNTLERVKTEETCNVRLRWGWQWAVYPQTQLWTEKVKSWLWGELIETNRCEAPQSSGIETDCPEIIKGGGKPTWPLREGVNGREKVKHSHCQAKTLQVNYIKWFNNRN